jgi:nicotinic acid mononucleotide adenylyltransferase
MCSLAAENTSNWLMVDPWEAFQSYQRTAIVLDHFDHWINTVLGGVHTVDGEQREVRVMLLAGSDLIGTMTEPGVWSYSDVCPSSSLLALFPGKIHQVNCFLSRFAISSSLNTFSAVMAVSS